MDHTTLVFDTFNVDLVVKVLANTAFSPFFTGMIPVFCYFHVGTVKDDTVVGSFYYFLLVSSFCTSSILSVLLRLCVGSPIGIQGLLGGARCYIGITRTFSLEAYRSIGANRLSSSLVVRRSSVHHNTHAITRTRDTDRCIRGWGVIGKYLGRTQRDGRRFRRQADRYRKL